MTYEEYLDEVTTLITEKYGLSDDAAIKLVMRAQRDGYFISHDDIAEMRTMERTRQDAKTLFERSKPAQQAAATPQKTKPAKTPRPKR